jgi:hypothetical protein
MNVLMEMGPCTLLRNTLLLAVFSFCLGPVVCKSEQAAAIRSSIAGHQPRRRSICFSWTSGSFDSNALAHLRLKSVCLPPAYVRYRALVEKPWMLKMKLDKADSGGNSPPPGSEKLPPHVRAELSALSEEDRKEILRTVGLLSKKEGSKKGRNAKPKETSAQRRARRKISQEKKAAEEASGVKSEDIDIDDQRILPNTRNQKSKNVEVTEDEKMAKLKKGWESIFQPRAGADEDDEDDEDLEDFGFDEDEDDDDDYEFDDFEEDGLTARDDAFFSKTDLPQGAG